MSAAEPFLPSATFPITSPLTASALPEDATLSASPRFCGAALATAAFPAAMKPALSNPLGLAAAIWSACAALAWLALSSDGGSAALRAWSASAAPDGGFFAAVAAPCTRPPTPPNFGAALGAAGAGVAGGGGGGAPG